MLVFDELKKNDPQLRLVAMVLAGGLCLLLAGLWWVQVVSARQYESHLEIQAYRTIRLPAVRGKILDREGRVLAENHACYNLSLYLDDLGKPLPFDTAKFNRHYATQLAMPFAILPNLDAAQIARFEENFPDVLGADLDLQPVRSYPFGTTAAHVLGELRQDDSSLSGEESFFNYRLPDYRGVTGIEGRYNAELHGRAGAESVLVNNLGYRQSEDVDSVPQPGENIMLTLDLDIQRAAEESLVKRQGADAHAAVVVMEVNTGDVLAMASSPTFDPNDFAQGISTEKYARLQELTAEKNRATYENYCLLYTSDAAD